MIRKTTHAAAIALVLTGCAHPGVRAPQRQVGLEMILPRSAEQVRLKDKEAFLLPSPIEADLPAYPETLAGAPSMIICAQIVVSAQGDVASVRQIDDADACEPLGTEISERLMPSVAEALRKWTFAAAAICRYETAEAECDDDSANATAQLTPIAVKLAYKIEFVRIDGVATVRKRSLGDR